MNRKLFLSFAVNFIIFTGGSEFGAKKKKKSQCMHHPILSGDPAVAAFDRQNLLEI
jgi:hypothetical protein